MEAAKIIEEIQVLAPKIHRAIIGSRISPSLYDVYQTLQNSFLTKGLTFDDFKLGLNELRDINSAKSIAVALLSRSLAYDVETASLPKAAELAIEYFSCFPEIQKVYTNTIWKASERGVTAESWSPFTSSTFDSGIIIITPTNFGILWVEEED